MRENNLLGGAASTPRFSPFREQNCATDGEKSKKRIFNFFSDIESFLEMTLIINFE